MTGLRSSISGGRRKQQAWCLDLFGMSMLVSRAPSPWVLWQPEDSWGIALVFLYDLNLPSPAYPTELTFPLAVPGQMPQAVVEQA